MNLKPEEILFEALEYPLYAVPEFWMKKQKESGWSVDNFFNFLIGECDNLDTERKVLKLKKDSKNKSQFFFGKGIEELTNGKVKSVYTIEGNRVSTLNEELLETFYITVNKTRKIASGEPSFSYLDKIEMNHAALSFMYNQFLIQTGQADSDVLFGEATKKGSTDKFVFYYYSLFSDVTLFNFYKYRNCFRELLLNSTNVEPLVKIAKPVLSWCKQIITLFNEVIQPNEEPFGENEKNAGKAKVIEKIYSFEEETFDFIMLSSYSDSLNRSLSGTTVRNRDIANFAYKVGYFLSNEVLPKAQAINEPTGKKYSVASFALLHVYWGKHDTTKAITKTNKKSFATKYEISDITLFDSYNKFLDKESRMKLSSDKKEQKNSVLPFIEKFEEAALMLKEVCKPAYDEIELDLNFLKTRYLAYLT